MEFRTKNKLHKGQTKDGNGLGMIQIGREDEKYKGYEMGMTKNDVL